MSLFKVTLHDRSKKVAVKASTVEEIIDKAIIKLNLDKGVYQVILDEDGTEVDDDEILLDLARISSSPVTLMLIPQGASWNDPSSAKRINNTQQSTKDVVSLIQPPPIVAPSIQDPNPSECGFNLWQKFPQRLLKSCEKKEVTRSDDRRAMVAVIADYMLHDLNDSSRKTAGRIARMIYDKYPHSFTDTINNEVLGDGVESLRCQIYTAVHYRKDSRNTKKRGRETGSDESDSEASSVSSVSRKQDEYGCVEYQPLLPEGETKASQEQKRLQLIQYHESTELNDEVVEMLMDETYPSQRMAINKPARIMETVFLNWPFLKGIKILMKHSSRLLGKSVQDVWNTSLSEKVETINRYFKSAAIAKEHKNRKRRTDPYQGTEENYVLKLLREAKEQAAVTSRSTVPQFVVVFPLIVHYMKEELGLFFIVVDEDLTTEAVQGIIPSMTPILIIRGKSIFDENAKCEVVLEKTISISTDGVLEGVLTTFLSYYIFGYSYPTKLCSTLEFIQRVFLGINPQKGDKTEGKKRRAMSYSAKVLRLTNELNCFTSQF